MNLSTPTTPLLILRGYLQRMGGGDCFSLAMHRFCSTKALSASLTFTMFVGSLAVAGRVLQNRVCLSFHLSKCFLEIGSIVFSKICQGARNPYEVVCDRARLFIKTFFTPKTGEMGQKMCEKWAKLRFFSYLLNNLVFNFY